MQWLNSIEQKQYNVDFNPDAKESLDFTQY